MRIKGLWAPHDPAPELFSPAPSCLQSELSAISWQEWQGSNLRPPVLETGALPIELHSYGGPASPPIRAVLSIGRGRKARAKRWPARRLTLFRRFRQQQVAVILGVGIHYLLSDAFLVVALDRRRHRGSHDSISGRHAAPQVWMCNDHRAGSRVDQARVRFHHMAASNQDPFQRR